MLSDDDEVQRLHATYVVGLLGPDDPSALALIRERLHSERHSHVAASLMERLGTYRAQHPEEVDQILAEVIDREPWATVLGTGMSNGDDYDADPFVQLVLWLAIRPQTANAVALTRGWYTQSIDNGVGQRCMFLIRDWLALPANRADERHRAFVLARTAATGLQAATQSTDDETQLRTAYQSADVLSSTVYFASGAYGDKGQNPTDAPEGFAEEAFELLELLTTFRHPSIIHHIVQTAKHLAPVDPRRAFGIVHRAVRPGEPYSYDRLAADVTVALIERYLADFRETVVTDQELLSQVRTVLDAFVRVGWPSAVSLSYRLGAAFR